MTVADFFSCALLAYGGPLAMFVLTVAREPVRVIVILGAAFAWLLSFLLASVVWFAVVPLRSYLAFGLVISVILQEASRYGVCVIVRKTERRLRQLSGKEVTGTDRFELSYVTGLGFGLISGAFALINVLVDSLGPGTMGLQSGSEYFVLSSAATTLAFILLHVVWTVIMCSACEDNDMLKFVWVVGSHLLVSSLSLLNRWQMYGATIPAAYTILLISAVIAFRSAGGTLASLHSSFTRSPPSSQSTEAPLT